MKIVKQTKKTATNLILIIAIIALWVPEFAYAAPRGDNCYSKSQRDSMRVRYMPTYKNLIAKEKALYAKRGTNLSAQTYYNRYLKNYPLSGAKITYGSCRLRDYTTRLVRFFKLSSSQANALGRRFCTRTNGKWQTKIYTMANGNRIASFTHYVRRRYHAARKNFEKARAVRVAYAKDYINLGQVGSRYCQSKIFARILDNTDGGHCPLEHLNSEFGGYLDNTAKLKANQYCYMPQAYQVVGQNLIRPQTNKMRLHRCMNGRFEMDALPRTFEVPRGTEACVNLRLLNLAVRDVDGRVDIESLDEVTDSQARGTLSLDSVPDTQSFISDLAADFERGAIDLSASNESRANTLSGMIDDLSRNGRGGASFGALTGTHSRASESRISADERSRLSNFDGFVDSLPGLSQADRAGIKGGYRSLAESTELTDDTDDGARAGAQAASDDATKAGPGDE